MLQVQGNKVITINGISDCHWFNDRRFLFIWFFFDKVFPVNRHYKQQNLIDISVQVQLLFS